ncbi:hypothetical protein RHGRI_025271 [Rhododendron griersonianum]|uniref:F-box domain-containing protein n=1 Tax=Rhododendron griersonianum TaxID=479676 RepID=A0AAV6JCP3_9ERIC|nr:hypothetical protein RHGRI_025271 [Rhododendron griersonianum]
MPEDLLVLILHRLIQLSDYFRFGAVCKPWHAAADHQKVHRRRDKQEVPMLLILPPAKTAEEADYHCRRLYSVTQIEKGPPQFGASSSLSPEVLWFFSRMVSITSTGSSQGTFIMRANCKKSPYLPIPSLDPIDDAIVNITNLKVLEVLFGNQLNGTIPENIGKLANLEQLAAASHQQPDRKSVCFAYELHQPQFSNNRTRQIKLG